MQSGDETNIHPLSQSQRKILSRYIPSDSVDQEPVSMHSRQGHHSIRAQLELDIPRPVRPASDRIDGEAVIVDVEPSMSSDLEERVRGWDYIGRAYFNAVYLLIQLC